MFCFKVEVEVDSVDRGGNFVGWLYVDGKNLSQLLLEEGFGRIHSSAERCITTFLAF